MKGGSSSSRLICNITSSLALSIAPGVELTGQVNVCQLTLAVQETRSEPCRLFFYIRCLHMVNQPSPIFLSGSSSSPVWSGCRSTNGSSAVVAFIIASTSSYSPFPFCNLVDVDFMLLRQAEPPCTFFFKPLPMPNKPWMLVNYSADVLSNILLFYPGHQGPCKGLFKRPVSHRSEIMECSSTIVQMWYGRCWWLIDTFKRAAVPDSVFTGWRSVIPGKSSMKYEIMDK